MICNGPGIKPGTDNDSPVVPKIETRRTWYWYPVDYSPFITMRRFSLDHGIIKSSRNVSCTTTVFAKRIYECREALWLDCHITTYGEPWWACLTRSDNGSLVKIIQGENEMNVHVSKQVKPIECMKWWYSLQNWGNLNFPHFFDIWKISIWIFPHFLSSKSRTEKGRKNSNSPNLGVSIAISYILCAFKSRYYSKMKSSSRHLSKNEVWKV